MLTAQGITCGMSRCGSCYDNAVMESCFSTVKSELGERFDSLGGARMELLDYLGVFYNQRRRHSTLSQVSPAAFEKARATQAAKFNRLRKRAKPTPSPFGRKWTGRDGNGH